MREYRVTLLVGPDRNREKQYLVTARTEQEAMGIAGGEYNNSCNEGDINQFCIKSVEQIPEVTDFS